MICMTDSKCVIFLSIMYLFFFFARKRYIEQKHPEFRYKNYTENKINKKLCFLFSA